MALKPPSHSEQRASAALIAAFAVAMAYGYLTNEQAEAWSVLVAALAAIWVPKREE